MTWAVASPVIVAPMATPCITHCRSATGSWVSPPVNTTTNKGLVRDLILKGEISKIKDVMEQNATLGMTSFDQAFLQLYAQGLITEEVALSNSDKQADLKVKLQQIKHSSKKTRGSESLKAFDTSVISFKD